MSIYNPPTPAAQKPQLLAFIALQKRGSDAKSSLFAIGAGGSARRELTPNVEASSTLVWSPNGQRLAFVSSETDIYTVNADGSRLTKQFSGNICKATNFTIAWYANSKNLTFARSCDGSTLDDPGVLSLYISDTSGVKGTKLIRNLEVGGQQQKTEISSEFYLSSDGQQVAFVKENNIYKMNADGSGMTKLTKSPGEYVSGGSKLLWSPDRAKIAFFVGSYPKQQIYTINSDGTNLKNLTNNPQHQVYSVDLWWSPDSNRIAYLYDRSGNFDGKNQDIYLIDVNRGTAKNITQKPQEYDTFSWSPDGKFIAFTMGDIADRKLYAINVETSKLTRLAASLELSGVYELAWSPDSQKIAFAVNDTPSDRSYLYAVDRDGSGLMKLTGDRDLYISNPVWQPQ
ncbi:MAG: DPP IV N-terminal domain-containing protein [Oscillatoriaceae cyanobacterium Prado104]|nr:DPP IV N-terminal domain-containing protein [Oscillatoriaceae cyanobacterium Prado104]